MKPKRLTVESVAELAQRLEKHADESVNWATPAHVQDELQRDLRLAAFAAHRLGDLMSVIEDCAFKRVWPET